MFGLKLTVFVSDSLYLLVFIVVSIFLALFLLGVSLILVTQYLDSEKTSSYECGFQPFQDTRQKFDIKYCLVAILFILFDLEIVFMLPWTQV